LIAGDVQTEGDDKPLKYSGMFRRARVMMINKIDLH